MPDDPQSAFTTEYNQRLGAFIQQFSHMEVALYFLLCKIANLEVALGAAFFSGTRLDGLISNIRRCYEAQGIPIETDLERCLQQAAILNGARNDVVHLVPDWTKDEPRLTEMTLTNRLRYLPTKAKDVVVSPKNLRAMHDDSREIEVFILSMADPEEVERTLPKTWQYKPPVQASKDRKPRTRSRKRGRPPQSSEA